jgi:hypothetical protein
VKTTRTAHSFAGLLNVAGPVEFLALLLQGRAAPGHRLLQHFIFLAQLALASAAAKPKIPAPKHSTMSSRQVSRHRIASARKRRGRRGKVDGCVAGSICRHAGSRDAGQQELMGFCRLVG